MNIVMKAELNKIKSSKLFVPKQSWYDQYVVQYITMYKKCNSSLDKYLTANSYLFHILS